MVGNAQDTLTRTEERKDEEQTSNNSVSASGANIQGKFVVKLPYAGALPKMYPIGKPLTVPGGNSDWEAVLNDQGTVDLC